MNNNIEAGLYNIMSDLNSSFNDFRQAQIDQPSVNYSSVMSAILILIGAISRARMCYSKGAIDDYGMLQVIKSFKKQEVGILILATLLEGEPRSRKQVISAMIPYPVYLFSN